MARSLLADAFDHHVWATLVVLDLLAPLSVEQLATNVPGTYGSILDTARHLVGADRWYLHVMSGGRIPEAEEEGLDVAGLRAAAEPNGAWWSELLAANPDPEAMFTYVRDDGSKAHATWGVRLAQAIDHGTDHRSQIFTALTTLGIEPPEIDVWAWGVTTGRLREEEAPADTQPEPASSHPM